MPDLAQIGVAVWDAMLNALRSIMDFVVLNALQKHCGLCGVKLVTKHYGLCGVKRVTNIMDCASAVALQLWAPPRSERKSPCAQIRSF